jgi:4-hydroxybenzoate polyprenyltransferase
MQQTSPTNTIQGILDKSGQNSHKHGEGHHHHKHSSRSGTIKKNLLRLVNSNAYVSIPILAITIETYMQIGVLNFHSAYIGFLFFSTLFLYPLHRLIGISLTYPIDFTKAQREVDKHPRLAQFSVGIGAIGTIYFSWAIGFEILQLLIPLGIVSIAYSAPVIPTTDGWKRLRDLKGIKIYAITGVVSITTAMVPLWLLNDINLTDILLIGFQRFLFILAITIPFDIRDMRMDEKWNLKTIPLLIGKEKALTLSYWLVNISSIVAISQFFITDALALMVVIAIVISNLWATYILTKFTKYNAPLFNAFMLEGTMIVHFALVTIASVGITLW